MPDERVSVRYMVDDVEDAVAFYTTHFGFTLRSSAAPAFADLVRGNLRLLLSGPASSAGRPMPDGRTPEPGGWNRIHFIVEDIGAEVERLRAAGLTLSPGDQPTITNVAFGSYAKRIGLEPGFKITAVVVPAPDRPSTWYVYAPALALVGSVWANQRRRARPLGNVAQPRVVPLGT